MRRNCRAAIRWLLAHTTAGEESDRHSVEMI
jgi:hypothetical protein